MTEPVVSLRISANERGTAPERFAAIVLETQRHPERWDVTVDGEAEVDLVVALGERGGGMTMKRSRSLEAIDEELAEIAERLKRPDTGVQWGWRK